MLTDPNFQPHLQRLLNIFQRDAFKTGDFTLASGKKSTYYINSKNVLFKGQVLDPLGEILYRVLKSYDVKVAGGLELGAIPMTNAWATRYAQVWGQADGFVVRKKLKDHGVAAAIEGCLPAGARVAILDDVVTTGSSLVTAIDAVVQAGGTPVVAVAIVDRLDGAAELMKARGIPFISLFTIEDFGVKVSAS